MISILFSIVSATLIYVIFKISSSRQIKIFPLVVINYFAAFILGLLLIVNSPTQLLDFNPSLLTHGIILGILFIGMFFLIGYATSTIGISVTSLATRVSLVIPVAFSIILEESARFSLLKIITIILALIGVVLISFTANKKSDSSKLLYFLPLILFIGSGFIDSFIKYAQNKFVTPSLIIGFTVIVFGVAFLIGCLILLLRKQLFSFPNKEKTLVFGILLGIVNFGSIFFIIKALHKTEIFNNSIPGSGIFGVNNLGIILLSNLFGFILFKEKLSFQKVLGIVISLIAVFLFIWI